MAKIRLNDKTIRRAAPPKGQIELWDTATRGFGLRISAGGSRTYFVMTRVGKTLVRRTVGKAPPPDTLPGAKLPAGVYWPHQARSLAGELLGKLDTGADPGPKRSARKLVPAALPDDASDWDKQKAAAVDGSFLWVAARYLDDTLVGGGARLASRGELDRKLKVDLLPWHKRPIADITARDINELVRAKARVKGVAGNRLLSFVKVVFRWAFDNHHIGENPAPDCAFLAAPSTLQTSAPWVGNCAESSRHRIFTQPRPKADLRL